MSNSLIVGATYKTTGYGWLVKVISVNDENIAHCEILSRNGQAKNFDTNLGDWCEGDLVPYMPPQPKKAEDFIIGQVGVLQPKRGETGTRKVRVFDVKASGNGLLLEVCDLSNIPADGRAHQKDCVWVMAYRVDFSVEVSHV